MAISDKIGDKIRKGPFSHGLAPRDKFEPRLSHVSDVVELRGKSAKSVICHLEIFRSWVLAA
jgi:hypothetical protein